MNAYTPCPERAPRLLIVDDEPDIVDIARTCFELQGWRVLTANNVSDARAVLQDDKIDAVLSDIMMRGGTGIELLHWVRQERGPGFVFYLLTGCIDERVRYAIEQGASGVFNKPCDWRHVVKSLKDAVAKTRTGTPAGQPTNDLVDARLKS